MTIYDIRANIRAHKSDLDRALKDKWRWGRWSEIIDHDCDAIIANAKEGIEELEAMLASRLFQQAQLSLFGGDE